MALDFIHYVSLLAKAKVQTEQAEQRAAQDRVHVQEALKTLASRATSILERGDANLAHGYEIAFLDSALANVDKADREHEVSCAQMRAAQERETLLEGIVAGLKDEQA